MPEISKDDLTEMLRKKLDPETEVVFKDIYINTQSREKDNDALVELSSHYRGDATLTAVSSTSDANVEMRYGSTRFLFSYSSISNLESNPWQSAQPNTFAMMIGAYKEKEFLGNIIRIDKKSRILIQQYLGQLRFQSPTAKDTAALEQIIRQGEHTLISGYQPPKIILEYINGTQESERYAIKNRSGVIGGLFIREMRANTASQVVHPAIELGFVKMKYCEHGTSIIERALPLLRMD